MTTPQYALDTRRECIQAPVRLGADPVVFEDAGLRELQDFVVGLEMLAEKYPDRAVSMLGGGVDE